MSSRLALHTAGYEPHAGGHSSPLPPPPPRDAPYSSPRRQHGLQPPVLSTAIPALQGGSTYSTPLSSISHQSPFSAAPSSPFVPAGTPIRASPMASRLSGNFNVPYDPRDWAPGTDTRAVQAQRARENAAEDGLASPPPPYSPEGTRSPRNGLERAQTTRDAQSSPGSGVFAQRRAGLASNAPVTNRHSIHFGSYAPPPPPSGIPPMPRQRVISDIQHGLEIPTSQQEADIEAPAARRATSANADLFRISEAGPSRSSSRQRNWIPGMPLPGPPPGPPPSTSRSQSTSGAIDRQSAQSRTRNLRQTIHISDLGPVPPTPSTWTDEQPLPTNVQPPLHIDTVHVPGGVYAGSGNTNPQVAQVENVSSPPATLSRSSAIRDNSAKGLRERRAQNRNSLVLNGDINALSVQTNPWADSLPADGKNSYQDAQGYNGPRSARLPLKAPSPLGTVMASHGQLSASPIQLSGVMPTSPDPSSQQIFQGVRSAGLPPKALPTPPLSQKAPLSAHSVMQTHKEVAPKPTAKSQDEFQQDASKRHAEFLEKEKFAKSDLERLQLFADYVLQEASLRQKRYETTFLSGDFDVDHLRSNLFKSSAIGRSASNSVSQVSADGQDPTTGNTTPQTRPETMWWKDYQPALSPIASMDYDEMSSRGRAPSRWWESQTGSQSGGVGGRTVHRSKRESKYMGLSKEFLMAHSPSEEYPATFNQIINAPDPSTYPAEKANPDSFGYFENGTPRRASGGFAKKPETPALLDISRFITLPPPYPRHYPAVNNNHPGLAEYRTTVRTLGELDQIKSRKARHKTNVEALQIEHKRRMSESRKHFSANIQAQVAEGSISYTEAAEAEEAFKMSEFDTEKQCLQSEFDTLQDVVINPLHDMLHERITQLNQSIQKLSDDLHTDARYQDPDQPQEEGDEKPELLEKLTQLKWLFDVREQIHRECFELLSERNDKFRTIVLLPYQFSKNLEKIRDTEAFFDKDTQSRVVVYYNESLKRHETFLQTVEQHVRRGVELQSSAFWDIAPGLVDLLQKIPEDLRHCQGIQISDKEYNENPSYHQHPQQYLYSLLSHAEKSTYQYIEGQVNLHCLLHEVKTALLSARYRALETSEGHSRELTNSKTQEETFLTGELKQKASMIEQQWLEALGSQLQATRERVKALLQEDDAWEEIAAEDT